MVEFSERIGRLLGNMKRILYGSRSFRIEQSMQFCTLSLLFVWEKVLACVIYMAGLKPMKELDGFSRHHSLTTVSFAVFTGPF
jgi:hypothetical protein